MAHKALRAGASRRSASIRRAGGEPVAAVRDWREVFLSNLAATSNVTASARVAKISKSTAYDTRRQDPEFHRRWQEALCEGYDHLEMNLLHRLREGELKPAPGAKKGARSFDNATAFRLLTVHREQVARQRAITENRNAEAILASIDAKIDRMRERSLARHHSLAGHVEGTDSDPTPKTPLA